MDSRTKRYQQNDLKFQTQKYQQKYLEIPNKPKDQNKDM